MNLLLPKTYVPLTDFDKVVFLAGPIRGGGDWQKVAINRLAAQFPEALIVCPCRYGPTHELYSERLMGETDRFESQTEWERFYMLAAAARGALMFWIPKEDAANPRPREEGPYGRDTYGELGEWRVRLMMDRGVGGSLTVVLGAEPDGLNGLDVIKKNYRYATGRTFHDSFEDTIQAVMTSLRA